MLYVPSMIERAFPRILQTSSIKAARSKPVFHAVGNCCPAVSKNQPIGNGGRGVDIGQSLGQSHHKIGYNAVELFMLHIEQHVPTDLEGNEFPLRNLRCDMPSGFDAFREGSAIAAHDQGGDGDGRQHVGIIAVHIVAVKGDADMGRDDQGFRNHPLRPGRHFPVAENIRQKRAGKSFSVRGVVFNESIKPYRVMIPHAVAVPFGAAERIGGHVDEAKP